MLLKNLVKNLHFEEITGPQDINIYGISIDSNDPKDLYVCIKGFKTDSHDFIEELISKGVKAFVVDEGYDKIFEGVTFLYSKNTRESLAHLACEFYRNPSSKFKLIGITGTNGKTTVSYLIKAILEKAGLSVGLIGTNQNMIGSKVIKTKLTTPDSLTLQKLFNKMKDTDYVVMEVSSHALELDRVTGSNFEMGVFTNITQDHLDFHKTMENYLSAKTKLFKICNKGIINIDEDRAGFIIENSNCEVKTYSIDNESDFKAEDVTLLIDGIKFRLGEDEFKLKIPGKFSVYNALAAISACEELGIEHSHIKEALSEFESVTGRFQVIRADHFTIIIDYAHTPDGLLNILTTVKEFATGRIVTLMGCGGDRDKTKRPIMGEIATKYSDFCIITSDNPRTEEPMSIIKDIEAGTVNGDYIIIENREKAIEYAIKNAKRHDTIILAGKGHETYQILKDEVIDFDEKKIVEKYLAI